MKLTKFLEQYPQFQKYYEFLKPYLPDPDRIRIYKMERLRKIGIRLREIPYGCVIPPYKIFFAKIPPSIRTFVHELIHLCQKPRYIYEELYGNNLTEAVIFCVEMKIEGNPLLLYSLRKSQILEVLRKFGFNSIEEFYYASGVIPSIYDIDPKQLKLKPWVQERDEVILFVSAVVDGLLCDDLSRDVFKELMELCK